MSHKEKKLQPLSFYDAQNVRLSLVVESKQHEFQVDVAQLSDLARFFGFAEIRVLSSGWKPQDNHTFEAYGITHALTDEDLPLKAQWQRLDIFINLNYIKDKLPEGFTDQDLGGRLEYLITDQISRYGERNLKKKHIDALILKDVFAPLFSAVAVILLAYDRGVDLSESKIALLVTLVVLTKVLLSNLETLALYSGKKHGARFTLLEGAQLERRLFSQTKLETASLMKLEPKKPA